MSDQSPRYQFHPPALKDMQFTGGGIGIGEI